MSADAFPWAYTIPQPWAQLAIGGLVPVLPVAVCPRRSDGPALLHSARGLDLSASPEVVEVAESEAGFRRPLEPLPLGVLLGVVELEFVPSLTRRQLRDLCPGRAWELISTHRLCPSGRGASVSAVRFSRPGTLSTPPCVVPHRGGGRGMWRVTPWPAGDDRRSWHPRIAAAMDAQVRRSAPF